ncbi:MAG: hypothetical protein ACRD2F_05070 [Terriglobales bacterium]
MPFTWIRVLAYAVGTVLLVAVVFSLAQLLLARLYGEKLESADSPEPEHVTEPAAGRRR